MFYDATGCYFYGFGALWFFGFNIFQDLSKCDFSLKSLIAIWRNYMIWRLICFLCLVYSDWVFISAEDCSV